LLTLLFTGSFSFSKDYIIENYLEMIGFIVILSFFFEHLIERSNSPYSLRNLLEIGLRVNIESFLDYMIDRRIDMLEYKLLGALKSLRKIESSDQGFKSIGENIWILMSGSKEFST
jgi:hypothetical protein